MLDKKLVPYLVEVNQMPSFQTDSPLDYKIKKAVINDSLSILNLSIKRRNRMKSQKKIEL
jgi:tubulin polyglutamylase TTLL6/13